VLRVPIIDTSLLLKIDALQFPRTVFYDSCFGVLCYRRAKQLTVGDAFVGYHDDTAASVVMQICGRISEDKFPDQNIWIQEVIITYN
jgi:hypothetical protein